MFKTILVIWLGPLRIGVAFFYIYTKRSKCIEMNNIKKSAPRPRKSTAQKKKIFLEALEKSHGVITPALLTAKIVRTTYHNWLNNDIKFKDAVEEVNINAVSFVESKLYQLIDEGDKTAVIFYLKTRTNGKYVEIQHIQQNTTFTQPLQINVIAPEIPKIENTTQPEQIEIKEQKKLE